ncbi:MAG: alkaline phosphatase family protein [Candidatus Acidiferrales bacterium]
MSLRASVSKLRDVLRKSLVALTIFQISFGAALASPLPDPDKDKHATESPIKHAIVLIGENRTFDHLFATYVSPSGDAVKNLLSEHIINADGTPARNFSKAAQSQAIAPFRTTFYISLDDREKAPYTTLPETSLNFSPSPVTGEPPPFPVADLPLLGFLEPSLETPDLVLLTTGASGANQTAEFLNPVTGQILDADTRIANFNALPNGPFPLTGNATSTPPGNTLPYDSYTGDTTHRLYEMWQQSDCNIRNATRENPSGCLSDLYPFVISNYTSEPDPGSFVTPGLVDDNGEGNSMAFYNMQAGDVAELKKLADEYSMSDNYHQAVMGGTGANHVMLGTGDAFFWSDGNGNPTVPPAAVIANPNPIPGSNDQYIVDLVFNGDFTNCADSTQPGVDAVRDYLATLPYRPRPNCEPNHYYLINNENPGFLPDGVVDTAGIASGASIPPTNVRTIGEALNEKGISWAYYGGAYDAAVALSQDPTSTNPAVQIGRAYCNICNFESYTNAIMGNAAQRTAHIKDTIDFFNAVDNSTLPAVSFVKPDGLLDGHPASSKEDLFEAMVRKIMDHLQANPDLFASTALMITMDEGGGLYDSGYIQPLDFFGDGPRIPMIVVSPYSRGGHVSHVYSDHVSVLKFIERNWHLQPLTARSRDNFPNPKSFDDNLYVPRNSPAIGDLFDLFDFDHGRDH